MFLAVMDQKFAVAVRVSWVISTTRQKYNRRGEAESKVISLTLDWLAVSNLMDPLVSPSKHKKRKVKSIIYRSQKPQFKPKHAVEGRIVLRKSTFV